MKPPVTRISSMPPERIAPGRTSSYFLKTKRTTGAAPSHHPAVRIAETEAGTKKKMIAEIAMLKMAARNIQGHQPREPNGGFQRWERRTTAPTTRIKNRAA